MKLALNNGGEIGRIRLGTTIDDETKIPESKTKRQNSSKMTPVTGESDLSRVT
uniref:Uncharacterized protein n=1 Tax=Octopus bimaculoides TaxID=37653 RepID=A0A0L8IAZ8_OCTBM